MSTGRKFRLSFVLRCAWSVFGMGALLAVQTPVRAAPSAYVVNQCASSSNCTYGTVSVIDTASGLVTATIPVGIDPQGVAVSPSGRRVYVNNYCGNSACFNGTVSVIDTATNAVTATITVGANPIGVTVNPDGSRVYVANNGSDTVSVIDTATGQVTGSPITVGVNPFGVAVSPDGSRVYATNDSSDSVSVIDTATDQVTASIIESDPLGVAVSPDGSRVYVSNNCTYGSCLNGTVSVIDTATNAVTATITVGANPIGVTVNPDGSRVYVANQTSDSVSVIDTATGQVTATIPIGSQPIGVAVSPDGSRLYVANSGGMVSVINTASNSVVTTITVGTSPYSFGAFVGPGALIATNSSGSGMEGQQLSGTVPALTNTTGCATSDAVVQNPAHGSLVFVAATRGYIYTPSSATYVGPDAFTWNGTASGTCTEADNPTAPVSNMGTVTFTLKMPPPVASDGSVTVAEGQAVTGQLKATGPSGQTLTYALVTMPGNGTITFTASTGVFTYTPATGFAGTDSFIFDAEDSGGTSNTATETVSVMAPPEGGALGLGSIGVLGAGLFFSRSQRKKRLTPG